MGDEWADRFRSLRAATHDAVLRGPGESPAEVRQAVARGEGPEELRGLVDKIRRCPWQVDDDDWAALRARYTEDELFELVVAATIGAADERLAAGLRALEEA